MRVAFLGMGRRSQGFLQRFSAEEGIRVVAGADSWDAARRRAEHVCPHIDTFETPEALFANYRDIDLAMVMSRECDHEAFALTAFGNGSHVFVEKPMAITPQSCRNMINAAQDAHKGLMVGFNLRFHPAILEAKRFIDDGHVGKLRAIWEWHEVDLNYFHNWMSVRAFSGGLLFEKGSHDFDLFNFFVGSLPTKVAAFGGLDYYGGNRRNDLHCPTCSDRQVCMEGVEERCFPIDDSGKNVINTEQTKCAFRQEIDVCDNHVVNLLYPNGTKASYTEIHGSPVKQRRFVLFGEKGRLEFNIEDNSFSWHPRDRAEAPRHWTAEKQACGHGGADPALHNAIIAAFRDGGPIPVTGEDGLNSILVSHAAETSIHTTRVVDLAQL